MFGYITTTCPVMDRILHRMNRPKTILYKLKYQMVRIGKPFAGCSYYCGNDLQEDECGISQLPLKSQYHSSELDDDIFAAYD